MESSFPPPGDEVLVFGSSPLIETCGAVLGAQYRVASSSSVDAALTTLARQAPSLLIADLDSSGDGQCSSPPTHRKPFRRCSPSATASSSNRLLRICSPLAWADCCEPERQRCAKSDRGAAACAGGACGRAGLCGRRRQTAGHDDVSIARGRGLFCRRCFSRRRGLRDQCGSRDADDRRAGCGPDDLHHVPSSLTTPQRTHRSPG